MNTKEKAYLDANFLIYWCFPKNPEIRQRVRFLLAKIFKNYELYTSSLSLDETWWGIKDEYNTKFKTQLACYDEPIFSKLKGFTGKILEKIEISEFKDPKSGIFSSLSSLRKYKLRPRDAFHLTLMQNNEIINIITDDSDFINKQNQIGIKVISP